MPDALLLSDARYTRHRSSAYHPERPERLKAAEASVVRAQHEAGITFAELPARLATTEELTRVHTPDFVKHIHELRGARTTVDADTYVNEETSEVALLAAGGTVALVDALIEGTVAQGVALVRPPGHHARADRAMGFCILNNIAVAAAHARAKGLERIAVVDFDVHHGNGTQEMFYRDPHVLYVSTHQSPCYPGTGSTHETGESDGTGFTVNVPLDAGGGDATYRAAFERVVLPVLEEYRPELVLVSAGFDAAARDPLADMMLSEGAYGWMTRELRRIADRCAAGRMALVLEGGYDLVALEKSLLSAIVGMMASTAPDIDKAAHDPSDVERARASAKKSWTRL